MASHPGLSPLTLRPSPGARLEKSSIDREWPELRFHVLRHSGFTWSAETGASLAELMRRPGHPSQSATLRYHHATDTRDRVSADALAELAIKPTTPIGLSDQANSERASTAVPGLDG